MAGLRKGQTHFHDGWEALVPPAGLLTMSVGTSGGCGGPRLKASSRGTACHQVTPRARSGWNSSTDSSHHLAAPRRGWMQSSFPVADASLMHLHLSGAPSLQHEPSLHCTQQVSGHGDTRSAHVHAHMHTMHTCTRTYTPSSLQKPGQLWSGSEGFRPALCRPSCRVLQGPVHLHCLRI